MCQAVRALHQNLTKQYAAWLDHIASGMAADAAPPVGWDFLRSDPQLRDCVIRTAMRDAHRLRRKPNPAQDGKLAYDRAPPWVEGVERRGLPMPALSCDPRQVQVAFHESGHAVAMRALGAPIRSVALRYDVPTKRHGGQTVADVPDTVVYGADAQIIGAISGNIAEELAGFEPHDFADDSGLTDNLAIVAACDSAMTPQVFEMTMTRCRDHAYDILRANWVKVDRLATFLLDHGRASANEVALLLEG